MLIKGIDRHSTRDAFTTHVPHLKFLELFLWWNFRTLLGCVASSQRIQSLCDLLFLNKSLGLYHSTPLDNKVCVVYTVVCVCMLSLCTMLLLSWLFRTCCSLNSGGVPCLHSLSDGLHLLLLLPLGALGLTQPSLQPALKPR